MSESAQPPLTPEIIAALDRGEKIVAIKLLRQRTGLGLKEAKDVIDAHVRDHPADTSRMPERDHPRRSGLPWLVILGLIALIVFLLIERRPGNRSTTDRDPGPPASQPVQPE